MRFRSTPTSVSLSARVRTAAWGLAWCATLLVAREAAAQATTTTLPGPVVTTTLPGPGGTTTTTLPGPGGTTTTTLGGPGGTTTTTTLGGPGGSTTTTLPGPGGSTTTTTSITTTTTTTTTSSTMVTSSTLLFSGFLQVDVQVEGQGAWTFTDDMETGAVNVSVNKPGVLDVQATASQDLRTYGASIALHATPPATSAHFRNLSGSELAFTVTVTTADFTDTIGPSLWYGLALNGVSLNKDGTVVDIVDNYIDAYARPGDYWMGSADQGGMDTAGPFRAFDRGVFAPVDAEAVHFTWTFSLGAHDEIDIGPGDELKLDVGNQARQCVTKMNGAARKIGIDAMKSDIDCLKAVGDATACVDNPADEHTLKSIAKALDRYGDSCSIVPAWGVNSSKCCVGGDSAGSSCVDSSTCGAGTCNASGCVETAPDKEANALAHDFFGATVTVPAGKKDRACMVAAARAADDVWTTRWQAFTDCKGAEFSAISGDATLKSTCLVPQPDAGGRIAKTEAKVATTVQKKCIDAKNVSALDVLFPGDCAAAGPGGLASCLTRVARCRFCRAVNVADAILPAVDCDLFDDATANGSCPAGP